MSQSGFSVNLSNYQNEISRFKIGIAYTLWNSDIVNKLKDGTVQTLLELGVPQKHIVQYPTPGAVELPLTSQILFEIENVDAVICLGAVIKGDTPHFDYVCQVSTKGIIDVSLKFSKPNIMGILTVLNEEQAQQRIGGTHGHKGKESAYTAIHQLLQYNHFNK
ncbi:MAG: 6,7-dimethyl-8-ribityllumazine synthase [Bacteroidia bacterium]